MIPISAIDRLTEKVPSLALVTRSARRCRQRFTLPCGQLSPQCLGDGSSHHLGDLLLYRGAPFLERVGHRPHVPVVEVGRVLEAQG